MTDAFDGGIESFAPGLYVVATPIGNLGDWTPRARALVAAASLVAAEDTRVSRKLLELAGSRARMVSLNEHNLEARAGEIFLQARTGVVALVSDAGTPAISDPGARLVAAAHAAGVLVVAIPGASALTAAVSVGGFDGSPVVFFGFLPRPKGERLTRLTTLRPGAVAVVFESPGRTAATLHEIAAAFDDPEVAVCRELTKVHEQVRRGRASALAAEFATTRGEVVLVFQAPDLATSVEDDEVVAYLEEMHRAGARRAGAAAEAARRFSVPRERAYALWPAPDADEPS